jgi:hypothetical protein
MGEPALDELPVYFLPDGKQLRGVGMGYGTALSDLYWLREIQYIGTPAAKDAHYPQLLALGELVTELDPLHGYAYQVTGLILASVQRHAESNQIFDKGRSAVPDRWELPFFEAFNEYYELRHYARGAELLTDAARIPGSPRYVSRLATMLYAAAGDVGTAMGFVENMLGVPDLPDEVRKDLEEQRFGLHVEQDLQAIERGVAAFAKREGHYPAQLTEIVGDTIAQLPVPPAGSDWIYNPQTGRVLSSLQEMRLRYKRELGPDDREPLLQVSP